MKRGEVCPTPCDACPFRARFKGEADFLRPGRRRGIVSSLQRGGYFPCHKELVHGEDDEGNEVVAREGRHCAGAALVMLRADRDTQWLRVSRRVGRFDEASLLEQNQGVALWTFADCLADGLDEVTPCESCSPGCLAPAGYWLDGEIVRGEESADGSCIDCDAPLCSECADVEGRCLDCSECEDVDDEDEDV